jgi:soluble lytic murein transglycosylase-like protein
MTDAGMVHLLVPAVLVLALAGTGASLPTPVAPDLVVTTGAATDRDIALLDLAAVRRLVAPLSRPGTPLTAEERAAALADVAQVCEAILGQRLDRDVRLNELIDSVTGRGPRVTAAAGVARRDAAAYLLLGVGYSARETADVVSGRFTTAALDTARRIRAVGLGRERAADYLDREYQRVAWLRQPPAAPVAVTRPRPSPFAPVIDKYARAYGVDADVVRAIIQMESSFSPTAISRAGAIGLMQLMPATARELGVSPHEPEQNIEGGIRYFAGLLRMFGRLDLALVAYNGGPGYAQRYARGHAVLYGETRAYVRGVLERLARPGRP